MVVLATKLYVSGEAERRSRDALASLVDNAIGDLDVEYDVGVRHDGFVSVTVDGEDAVVARNLLREEWGEITPELDAGETYVGTLESWDDDGIVLDAGQDVRVPADELGLGPGTPEQIVERFGLVQHLPLRFVAGGEDAPARLADEERDRLFDWTRGAGRVNVNSTTRGEARATVNRAGHAQDIVTVERLGLLEQSIVCKEDTDPPGLLASIGEYLPAELRCVIP
ncbi:DUF2110 family protein [halophilic archaeon]|uniref:DUF2110 family protein n=1 Tax=Halomicrococcus sp. SG-WS-1 TaxID=3439057 RepID=UPI000DDD8A05|nr:DUF2110 domain-containing protein [halophilic archaeon]